MTLWGTAAAPSISFSTLVEQTAAPETEEQCNEDRAGKGGMNGASDCCNEVVRDLIFAKEEGRRMLLGGAGGGGKRGPFAICRLIGEGDRVGLISLAAAW